ncbi:MAG: hypothetical protein H0Z33_09580 [Bacillaceae bacterium]|nr:hypothetical protein [Bacillaceae bacterium]
MSNMPKAFHQLFWGFLMVLIDIFLFRLDLFPDFVGFLIIHAGLRKLELRDREFVIAKKWTTALVFLSFPALYQFSPNVLNGIVLSNRLWLSITFSIVLGLMHLILVYYIVKGMIHLVESEKQTLARKSEKRLNFYVGGILVSLVILTFIFNVPEQIGAFLLIGSSVISLIVEISFLVLLKEYQRLYQVEKAVSNIQQ